VCELIERTYREDSMAAVAGLRALLTMGARGRTAVNEVIAAQSVLQIAVRSADAQLASRAKTALAQLDRAAPPPNAGKK
jgi:hypothetical protein